MTELQVVRATGDAYTRGLTVGSELADRITASIEFYHRYLDRRGVSSTDLQELLTPYLVAAESTFPEMMSTLKGMSIGAMVPVLELFAVNAFEELEPLLESPEGELLFLQRKEGYLQPPASDFPDAPPPNLDAGGTPDPGSSAGRMSTGDGARTEHCSSFSVTGRGTTILAHSEHWLAGDLENVALVVDVPDGGVPVASPTVVCCLPAVGVNGAGGAQGIGSLTACDDGVGVPRVLVSRSSLAARDREDAVRLAGLPNRAGGYGHVFGFAGGDTFSIETTGERVAVIEGPGPHTNHYLDPALAELAPPASLGSRARLERLRELLAERRPTDVDSVMEIMRDHDSDPQAICLHADPGEGDEASAVMFSMVADLDAGAMWIAPGNPCENDFVQVDLTGVRS